MIDFEKRIDPVQFEAKKTEAILWIQAHMKPTGKYKRAYQLKQRFTSRQFYCYQRDFFDYCVAAGLKGLIDAKGDHWIAADYRKGSDSCA